MKLCSLSNRRRNAGINLTALIDVMFMLVIFLSVTGNFSEQSSDAITLPESGYATPRQNVLLVLNITADKDFIIDNRRYSEEQLRVLLASDRYPKSSTVLLRLDAEARHKTLIAVLDILREHQFTRISFGTRTPQP